MTWTREPRPRLVPVVAERKESGTAKTRLMPRRTKVSQMGVSMGYIFRKIMERMRAARRMTRNHLSIKLCGG